MQEQKGVTSALWKERKTKRAQRADPSSSSSSLLSDAFFKPPVKWEDATAGGQLGERDYTCAVFISFINEKEKTRILK